MVVVVVVALATFTLFIHLHTNALPFFRNNITLFTHLDSATLETVAIRNTDIIERVVLVLLSFSSTF